MRYEKQSILTNDQNPDGGTDYEAEYPFLSAGVVHSWEADSSSYGHNLYSLQPAFSTDPQFSGDKGRCWLIGWSWSADEGYTASGYGSNLIPFAEGCRILIEADRFSFSEPVETRGEASARELDVRGELKAIEAARGDDERAHVLEDELYHRVLGWTAEGVADARKLARLALESQQIDFARWCA